MRKFLVLLAVPLALAGCWNSTTPEKQSGSGTVVDLDEPIGKDVIAVTMPGKKVIDAKHGAEAFFAVGPMDGVNDTPANGVTTLHVFADKATIADVGLNIAVPENGTFYEAWLADASGKPVVSMGHLTNPFSDVRHSVKMENPKDLRAYTTVVVTLEMDDGDPAPSASIVAKGTLKPQKRG